MKREIAGDIYMYIYIYIYILYRRKEGRERKYKYTVDIKKSGYQVSRYPIITTLCFDIKTFLSGQRVWFDVQSQDRCITICNALISGYTVHTHTATHTHKHTHTHTHKHTSIHTHITLNSFCANQIKRKVTVIHFQWFAKTLWTKQMHNSSSSSSRFEVSFYMQFNKKLGSFFRFYFLLRNWNAQAFSTS